METKQNKIQNLQIMGYFAIDFISIIIVIIIWCRICILLDWKKGKGEEQEKTKK